MTVAEIKEYIDGVLKETENIELPLADIDFLRGSLKHTRSMLDELEPKAKWVKKNNAYYCSSCGSEYHTSSITPLPNVCIECGARMEVEDDTTPTNV